MASCKASNVARHYNRNHSKKFAHLLGDARNRKLAELKMGLQSEQRAIRRVLTEAEMVTLASYKIALILAKKKKPYTDGEMVKECVLESMDLLCSDFKQKEDILNRIRQMQLSARTVTRRTSDMADDIAAQLKNLLSTCEAFSFALDESVDVTDIAQLCVWVKLIDEEFRTREELLSIKGLHDRTQGKDIFAALNSICTEFGLSYENLVAVTTDGAPSMVGRQTGLAGLLSTKNPNLLFFHCIIHQEALCAKVSNGRMSDIMADVVKVVNLIRARSSLTHRQFKEFLAEIEAEYSDLILHADVRWLSKGKVLNRFLSLLPEIIEFLTTKKLTDYPWFESLSDTEWIRDVAFMADITAYLNILNRTLQKQDTPLAESVAAVNGFRAKLELWAEQLASGEMSHFKMLQSKVDEQPNLPPRTAE